MTTQGDVKLSTVYSFLFFVYKKFLIFFSSLTVDFGLCVDLNEEKDPEHMVGSPFWMPPEMIKRQVYGPAVDIWSFAICVLELANGQPPNRRSALKVRSSFCMPSPFEVFLGILFYLICPSRSIFNRQCSCQAQWDTLSLSTSLSIGHQISRTSLVAALRWILRREQMQMNYSRFVLTLSLPALP